MSARVEIGLLDGMLNAPLAGIVTRQRRCPRVLHAITMEGVCKGFHEDAAAPFVAACGASGLKLYPIRYAALERAYALLWPPEVKSLPSTLVRCKECFQATGRKRPRSVFGTSDRAASSFKNEGE